MSLSGERVLQRDNKARVDYAANVKADIYVSIHLNSSPSPSASGAEVYYRTAAMKLDRERGKDLSEGRLLPSWES